MTEDTPLAALWAGIRTLRFADGPDVRPSSLLPASSFLSALPRSLLPPPAAPNASLTPARPQEVHISQIGLQELKRAPALHAAEKKIKSREAEISRAGGLGPAGRL